MERETTFIKKESFIRDNFLKISSKEMANITTIMGISMKDHGLMMSRVVKMEIMNMMNNKKDILEILKMVTKMDKGHIFLKMETDIRENSEETKEKVKEHKNFQMVMF